MEGEDFLDWELLHESDSPISVRSLRNYQGIEDVSEGMIQADYFSIDGSSKFSKYSVAASEEGCNSDNPSWVDPASGGYGSQFPRKNSGEFWSDSGSELPDDHRKVVDFDVKPQLKELVDGLVEKAGDLGFDVNKLSDFSVENEIIPTDFEDMGEVKPVDHDSDNNRFWSDSGGNELAVMNRLDGNELIAEPKQFYDQSSEDNANNSAIEKVKAEGDEEKRRILWWKVPLELLRYCVLRVGPVWSFSVAAAIVGFVILGRKLYRMKQKRRTLQLKVTLDDKKVSQFLTRTARLNEAFSVVRRVPMIRPALPPTGVAQWSAMGLR